MGRNVCYNLSGIISDFYYIFVSQKQEPRAQFNTQ